MKINFLIFAISVVCFSSLISSDDEVFGQLVNNYTTAKNFIGIGCILTVGGMIWINPMTQENVAKNLKEKTKNLINKTVCFVAGTGSALLTMYGITKYNLKYKDDAVSLPLAVVNGFLVVSGPCCGIKSMYDWTCKEEDGGAECDDRPKQLTPKERRTIHLMLLGAPLILGGFYCYEKLNKNFLKLHFPKKFYL